jgi:outer membrane receptor protein involved in Fe transport
MKTKLYQSKLYLLAFLLSVSWVSFGQNQVVSGKVTDEKGEPLIGVTVMVKETTKGANTNIDGKYSIPVSGTAPKLVYSFVGYQKKEVIVGNQTIINVSMVPDAQNLNEVVVVGYGVQKKATVSGSVVSVKGADLQKSPSVNLSNSIAGRMAGVVAVNRSGEPGYDGSAIRIRGANTLNNNDALIVIDGIPNRAGGLDRINPADI